MPFALNWISMNRTNGIVDEYRCLLPTGGFATLRRVDKVWLARVQPLDRPGATNVFGGAADAQAAILAEETERLIQLGLAIMRRAAVAINGAAAMTPIDKNRIDRAQPRW